MRYKKTDLYLQLVCIFLAGVFSLFNGSGAGPGPIQMIILLAIVQLVSLIANAAMGKQRWKSVLRKYHLGGTLLTLALLGYGLFKPTEDRHDMEGLDYVLPGTLLTLLLMLFYLAITFIEFRKMKTIFGEV